MEGVLEFLGKLHENNNRDWFNKHKTDYNVARQDFENLCVKLIAGIGEFDKSIASLSPKECMFRIYRDLRFSYDKTPYKTHFGAYIAFPGGRKSVRAGYYLHIDPVEGSFFSVGIWQPQPDILRALRQSIFENIEEFDEIRNEPTFDKYFGGTFYEGDKLKKMPLGFSKDFSDPEILKLKHYIVTHDLTTDDVLRADFVAFLVELAKIGYPMNKFLNFAIDELLHTE